MAVVLLPGLLASEAGGQKRFELDADTVGAALRALPVANLLLDESGALRPLVHVYVDGERERDLTAPLAPAARIRIVAAIAGGEGPQPDRLWKRVERLVERAPGVSDLREHRIHLIAARLLRERGLAVPPELAEEEELAAVAGLAVKPLLERVRAAATGRLVLMKGPELAALYPDPALRPLRDLDLLVEDAAGTHARLCAAGFKVLEGDVGHAQLHHLPGLYHPELPLLVEIHARPKWPETLAPPSVERLLAAAVPSTTDIEGVLTLPPAEHAVLVAAHSWAHLPLRRLLDLVDVALLAEAADPAELRRTAAELGVERVWLTTSSAANALLADGPRTWPLRTFARYLPAARERTVAESHLESWLSPFASLPPQRALAVAARSLGDEFRRAPGQTWGQKLAHGAAVARRSLEPKSRHDRDRLGKQAS